MILKDGNRFYCYYTAARINNESGKTENCIGIFSSEDLINWKDEGFVRLEYSLATPPESPFVVKRNGTYYLVYTNYKYGITYATSSDPVKGWKELPVEKMVLMTGVSASEIYQDNGKWYMSYISHQKNGLHFFEICGLQWNKDGSISFSKREEL
jgi:beta-xylosidase